MIKTFFLESIDRLKREDFEFYKNIHRYFTIDRKNRTILSVPTIRYGDAMKSLNWASSIWVKFTFFIFVRTDCRKKTFRNYLGSFFHIENVFFRKKINNFRNILFIWWNKRLTKIEFSKHSSIHLFSELSPYFHGEFK